MLSMEVLVAKGIVFAWISRSSDLSSGLTKLLTIRSKYEMVTVHHGPQHNYTVYQIVFPY